MSEDPAADDAADPVISHDQIRECAYDLWDRNTGLSGINWSFGSWTSAS